MFITIRKMSGFDDDMRPSIDYLLIAYELFVRLFMDNYIRKLRFIFDQMKTGCYSLFLFLNSIL